MVAGYYSASMTNNFTSDDLKILRCGNPTCTGGNSITSPDTVGNVGLRPALKVDALDRPVVVYDDISTATTRKLKLLRCGDNACSSGNTIVTVVTIGVLESLGRHALTLDSLGRPVIAYAEALPSARLQLLHCGDATCTSGNTTNQIDIGGGLISLVLDGVGNPVIAYGKGNDLMVAHCGNVNCSGAVTPVNVTNFSNSADSAWYPSLQLQGGNPVVAYNKSNPTGRWGLFLVRCNNASCSSVSAPVALSTGVLDMLPSLVIDPFGIPVLTFGEEINGDLGVLRCGNMACTAGNQRVLPDTTGLVGQQSSLILDGVGNPVVSYFDALNRDLRVMHCDAPACLNVTSQPVFPVPGPRPQMTVAENMSGCPAQGRRTFTNSFAAWYGTVEVRDAGGAVLSSTSNLALSERLDIGIVSIMVNGQPPSPSPIVTNNVSAWGDIARTNFEWVTAGLLTDVPGYDAEATLRAMLSAGQPGGVAFAAPINRGTNRYEVESFTGTETINGSPCTVLNQLFGEANYFELNGTVTPTPTPSPSPSPLSFTVPFTDAQRGAVQRVELQRPGRLHHGHDYGKSRGRHLRRGKR